MCLFHGKNQDTLVAMKFIDAGRNGTRTCFAEYKPTRSVGKGPRAIAAAWSIQRLQAGWGS